MHFPVGWDPYFTDYMTLRDVYHYPTQHYDHHRQQLTLSSCQGEAHPAHPCLRRRRRLETARSSALPAVIPSIR